MTNNLECDCSEEYGPCEDHSELMASREGASTRTADELLVIFIQDAVDLGATLSPYGIDVLNRAIAELAANEDMGVSWLSSDSLRDELVTVSDQVETTLYTMELSVFWEDGYRILKVTGGPLLDV